MFPHVHPFDRTTTSAHLSWWRNGTWRRRVGSTDLPLQTTQHLRDGGPRDPNASRETGAGELRVGIEHRVALLAAVWCQWPMSRPRLDRHHRFRELQAHATVRESSATRSQVNPWREIRRISVFGADQLVRDRRRHQIPSPAVPSIARPTGEAASARVSRRASRDFRFGSGDSSGGSPARCVRSDRVRAQRFRCLPILARATSRRSVTFSPMP